MDQKIKEVIENYFDLNSIAQNVMKQNVNQINESKSMILKIIKIKKVCFIFKGFKKNEITLEIIVVNLGFVFIIKLYLFALFLIVVNF